MGKGVMRYSVQAIGVLFVVSALVFSGCAIGYPGAPGLTILDTGTGKAIMHVKDASLAESGPWGPHDAEILIEGKSTDKTVRLIHTSGKNWCIREFDAGGQELATRSMSAVTSMHSDKHQYAFSPGFDRVAFCDTGFGISLFELKDNASRVLSKDFVKNPYSIKWSKWADNDSIVLFVDAVDKGPYRGSVVRVPVNGDPPGILYKHDRLWDAVLSPDMKYWAVVLMFKFPEPSQFVLVDLAKGTEEGIGTFARDDTHIGKVTWSPDGRSLAYACGMSVEMYSLDEGKRRVLKENPTAGDSMIFEICFLDSERLLYHYEKKDGGRARVEILAAKTGETLLSRKLSSVEECQVFDDGKRVAIQGQ